MVAKLTLVGNLGADPELRYTGDGRPIVTCRVASNYRGRNAETKEWEDRTNWYRVIGFGRLAERLSEQMNDGRLTKGTRVIVFGRLEASAYMDRGNQPQPSLEVVADDVLMAESRGRETEEGTERDAGASAPRSAGRAAPAAARGAAPAQEVDELEDLPF